MSDILLGPIAALAGAIVAVGALWREHLKHDADVRTQRDLATVGWREQTTATSRIADALEAERRDRIDRTRRTDR